MIFEDFHRFWGWGELLHRVSKFKHRF